MTWQASQWLGQPTLKCPFDLWTYQDILVELRPSLIIETGTYAGGSALFLASICDLLSIACTIVTIDIAPAATPQHDRILYRVGSSIDPEIVDEVRTMAAIAEGHVLVILDSDHRRDHVFAELGVYADLVTSGSYCIVEDSNINGHPVAPNFGPGPYEAVDDFLASRSDFTRDLQRERHMLTFNPGGYLKRIC